MFKIEQMRDERLIRKGVFDSEDFVDLELQFPKFLINVFINFI